MKMFFDIIRIMKTFFNITDTNETKKNSDKEVFLKFPLETDNKIKKDKLIEENISNVIEFINSNKENILYLSLIISGIFIVYYFYKGDNNPPSGTDDDISNGNIDGYHPFNPYIIYKDDPETLRLVDAFYSHDMEIDYSDYKKIEPIPFFFFLDDPSPWNMHFKAFPKEFFQLSLSEPYVQKHLRTYFEKSLNKLEKLASYLR